MDFPRSTGAGPAVRAAVRAAVRREKSARREGREAEGVGKGRNARATRPAVSPGRALRIYGKVGVVERVLRKLVQLLVAAVVAQDLVVLKAAARR